MCINRQLCLLFDPFENVNSQISLKKGQIIIKGEKRTFTNKDFLCIEISIESGVVNLIIYL